MNINEKSFALGSKRSIIREIFEFGKKRSMEVGAENVFDFSLGNPSVNPPKEITDTIISLLNTENATLLHGYTSAQGDLNTRKTIANVSIAYFSSVFFRWLSVGFTPQPSSLI